MDNKEIIQHYKYYLDKILSIILEEKPSDDWSKEQFIEYLQFICQSFEHISKKLELLADTIVVAAKYSEDNTEEAIEDQINITCPLCHYFQGVSIKKLKEKQGKFQCRFCKSFGTIGIDKLKDKYYTIQDYGAKLEQREILKKERDIIYERQRQERAAQRDDEARQNAAKYYWETKSTIGKGPK